MKKRLGVIIFFISALLLFCEEEIKTTTGSDIKIEQEEIDNNEGTMDKELEKSLNEKERIETKVVTEKKGIFEVGTYNMDDLITKKTRNNYRKFDLKKGDKIIIYHKGTNSDGIVSFSIVKKGVKEEKFAIQISPKTMPIYSLKQYK